mmetsp:Transcript_20084/g.58098  ORF Transcript_20084/g.58098 Transcript_20084/m.58098 type:complete len:590 (-) Transcript_20084:22-1791(-)
MEAMAAAVAERPDEIGTVQSSPENMVQMIFLLSILFLVFACACHCFVSLRRRDADRRQFNLDEWRIAGLPTPSFPVRLCDAAGCGCGPSCAAAALLVLLDRLAVRPCLRKSLRAMEKAEKTGLLSAVLVDAESRKLLVQRIDDLYDDIWRSSTLTVTSKVLNYAGAAHCLTNHRGLLELAVEKGAESESIVKPIFIVSLPRTGTTILHRTMSLDNDRWRSFHLSDMLCPLPSLVARHDQEGRRLLAEKAAEEFGAVESLFPGWTKLMETMHGFRFDEAEEDLGWYDAACGHGYFDVLMVMYPEQRSKVGGVSPLESKECARYRYAWLHMIMKIYQAADRKETTIEAVKGTPPVYGSVPSSPSQCGIIAGGDAQSFQENGTTTELTNLFGNSQPSADLESVGNKCCEEKSWLCKDPNHAAFLPELVEQFPDAKLIFIHRPPGEIVASMAKLFECFTCIQHVPGRRGTTSAEWGMEALKRTQQFCDGLVGFTRSQEGTSLGLMSGLDRRIDLQFEELVADIPGAIQIIYNRFFPDGPPPSSDAVRAFEMYLQENERNRRGNQSRSLEEFSLSEKDVQFSCYSSMLLAAHLT